MSLKQKFDIKSGANSRNYQAGRDINQNFGNIIQTLTHSRIAQVAAIMTIIAGIVAVAQYASSLPANFKLGNPSFKYNSDSGENTFQLVLQNQGPDNIKNLAWYAWLEGIPLNLKNVVHDRASIVARGDMYVVRNAGEGKLPADVISYRGNRATKVFVCLSYDGPLPGTRQWMLLSGTNQAAGGYYSGSLTAISGVPLHTVDTGGGLSLFSQECRTT